MIDAVLDFCYRLSHGAGWHGIGNGFDVLNEETISQTNVFCRIEQRPDAYGDGNGGWIQSPSKIWQVRILPDGTEQPLAVVGSGIQTEQVLDFYRMLVAPCVETHGLELSTACVLESGKRFFFCALIPELTSGSGYNETKHYATFAGSFDGTLNRMLFDSSIRTECNNKLQAGIATARAILKQKHKSVFDPQRFKDFLKETILVSQELAAQTEALQASKRSAIEAKVYLAEVFQPELISVKLPERRQLVSEILASAKAESDFQEVYANKAKRTLKTIVSETLQAQAGGDDGTLYGAYNAVSYHTDHNQGRSIAARLNSSMFGPTAMLKANAWKLAVDYADMYHDQKVAA